ncbi:MAG: cell division protein FtsL [Gammaproteobacteria bacterium CG11_big_fil_rev_8_21_14_0_20_46_22]|nr:MAG: cell division protein FtsL [Gammaproteobacteria bacterium CG12_big_fil_rev_8_21_14_0_65_46_12]PIR11902.1 MAG: cell division protein FtsL [Gammaproteobacteria bacterium CG11_big_fil_rev_8_21_14_0_20_46_22]
MNAYVKSLQHRAINLGYLSFSLSRMQWLVFGLALMVLASAFSMVYVKDMNRRLMSDMQTAQAEYVALHSQWSQLLVKEGSLASQTHVASLATKNMGMVMPKPGKIVMISA